MKNTLPPNIAINLIPEDPFMESIIGRFLVWALSVGRYVVIFTELIVIISFLSRFKLDRDLTDLNEAIARQKAIILSYQNLEPDYKNLQKKVEFIKLYERNQILLPTLSNLEKILPIDVKLTTLSINQNGWSISASALSAQSMKLCIDQLIINHPLEQVSVDSVKLDQRTGAITFDIKLTNNTLATKENNGTVPTTDNPSVKDEI